MHGLEISLDKTEVLLFDTRKVGLISGYTGPSNPLLG